MHIIDFFSIRVAVIHSDDLTELKALQRLLFIINAVVAVHMFCCPPASVVSMHMLVDIHQARLTSLPCLCQTVML